MDYSSYSTGKADEILLSDPNLPIFLYNPLP